MVLRGRPLYLMLFLLLTVVEGAGAQAGSPFVLPAGCRLPFRAIREVHELDHMCGAEGSAHDPAHREQNRIKNNFCAEGPPIRITRHDFHRLQEAVEEEGIRFGSPRGLPQDRTVLASLAVTSSGERIGEGAVVRFAAFVIEAHIANRSKGESVNCNRGGEENNDIHADLLTNLPHGEPDRCKAYSMQISPHFRPRAWNAEALEQLDRPVRITGPLYFDASHLPCRNGERVPGQPPRVSVWEIHPVYGIDVCRRKSLENCPVDKESRWIPLHIYWQPEEEIDE